MPNWQAIDDQLTTPAFFATGRHHEVFRLMREEDPIHWTVGKAVRPFWSLTRHADCKLMFEDAQTFSSEHGGIMPATAEYPLASEREALGYGANPTMTDPPRHLMMRQPFNKHWSAPAVARFRDAIQRHVDEIIAEILPRGACDLVEDLAAELPARLVCDLMGVPEADRRWIRNSLAAYMGAQDPQYQIEGSELKTQRTLLRQLFDYAFGLALDRRNSPAEDFTSIAATLRVNDAPMPDRDLAWWVFSFIAAGLETTRDALAVGIFELMRHPEQAERLRADPSLAPLAAEEIVRWVNPSKYKWRVVTRDVAFGNRLFRKGDWVVAWIAAANRDDAVFPHAQTLDIGRNPNPHLAFGAGEHSCIGRHLARLEIQLMLTTALRELRDLRPAGPGEWLASSNHTSFKRLPVAFTPRPVA